MGNVVHKFITVAVLVCELFFREPPKRPINFEGAKEQGVANKPVEKEPRPPAKEPAKKEPSAKESDYLVQLARIKLGMDVVNHYNFAFTGQSGCGKSSLINALRFVNDGEPEAAPVGEIETTKEIRRYQHPKIPHVALWDIPGAGTLQQPASTYFENQMLYAFDCILVLSSDRFLDIDFQIARKAVDYKRACAFVRTKADQSVKAIARRTKKTMLEASMILRKQVSESFKEKASSYGLANELATFQLFIVSAWAMRDETVYEYGRDKSLQEMDEIKCLKFVSSSVRDRAI